MSRVLLHRPANSPVIRAVAALARYNCLHPAQPGAGPGRRGAQTFSVLGPGRYNPVPATPPPGAREPLDSKRTGIRLEAARSRVPCWPCSKFRRAAPHAFLVRVPAERIPARLSTAWGQPPPTRQHGHQQQGREDGKGGAAVDRATKNDGLSYWRDCHTSVCRLAGVRQSPLPPPRRSAAMSSAD